MGDMGIIDTHIHIIPGVDDGATDISCSIAMIESEIKQGITEIIATPHDYAFDNNRDIYNIFSNLQGKSKINLYLGCEIYCDPYIMETVIDNLHNGIYPSMNGTQYILIEFDIYETKFNNITYCVKELINAGWKPIIAHAERYWFTSEKRIRKLKEMGCLIQINIYSILSETQKEIRRNAREMLNKRLVDLLGSDAHNMQHRPPKVKDGLRYLKTHYDAKYVNEITYENVKQYFNI